MASGSGMGPPVVPLAASTTTVPFTPRIPKQRDALRPRGELTGRELDRIAETLASVRKVNPTIRAERDDHAEDSAPDNSFHPADTSFQTRPLKSRVSSSTVTHRRPSHNRATTGFSSISGADDALGQPRARGDRHTDRDRERDRNRERPRGEDRYRSTSGTDQLDRKGKGRETSSSNSTLGRKGRETEEPTSFPSVGPRSRDEAAKQGGARQSDNDDDEAEETSEGDAEVTVRPPASGSAQQRLLVGVPLQVQEAWVCEDLAYVLRGVAGEIIRYDDDYDPLDESHTIKGARWQVDPSLDSSLLNVVQRLLPMATYYVAINAFVDSRHQKEWGMVNHALASGIRGVLREYHLMTTSLESLYLTSPTFTLQKAFYHLHPTSNTLSMLYGLCLALEYEDDSDPEDADADLEMKMELESLGIPGLLPIGLAGADSRANRGAIIGGEVLGVVTERAACTSGNPTSALLYSTLLLHASQPYAQMLLRWISTGDLQDPFSEFMVKENPRLNKAGLSHDFNDEYWERRYTLRDGSSSAQQQKGMLSFPSFGSSVPKIRPGTNRFAGGACLPFFLEPWKHKVLLAGKYLNVIRECGLEVISWEEEGDGTETPREVTVDPSEELIKMNDPKFYRRIDGAYLHANKKLLHLMVDDQELLPYLRSMKHFFFMDQSEFMNQFLENAASELKKKTPLASVSKLQSLMYLAVSNPASSSSQDPRKEDLKIVMKQDSVYEYLMKIVTREAGNLGALLADKKEEPKRAEQLAVEALCFDMDVKFPLSLIISRKSIDRYQIIFRFLFSLHYLQFQLGTMWGEHKSPLWRRKLRNAPDMEKWKRKIFDLRAQMMQWVQHVLNYVTSDVLERGWRKLEAKLANVQTVDQLLQDHTEYLEVCTKGCMLTDKRMLEIVTKLVNTVTSFAGHQVQFTRTLQKYIADRQEESVEAKIIARWKVLQLYETHWTHHILTQFDAMKYSAGSEDTSIISLTTRMLELRKASALSTEQAS